MKFSAIIVSALTGLAAAAPASTPASEEEKRGLSSIGQLGSGVFNAVPLAYLGKINNLNLNNLALLGAQNFNLAGLGGGLGLQNLFNQNFVDVQSLLAIQQIVDLLALQNSGVLNGFDLTGFQFPPLNLGLLAQPIGGFGLDSLIQPSVAVQVQTVATSNIILKE